MNIGLFVICTGKYDCFLQPLINSIDKWFFVGKDVDFYLFCDKNYKVKLSKRIKLHYFNVPRLRWPFPTLYRYKWFSFYSDKIQSKYVFYCDVDMLFVNKIDKEILPCNSELVATRHPGYYFIDWPVDEINYQSLSYVRSDWRKHYYCGGFQGGVKDVYLDAAKTIDKNIDEDFKTAKLIGFTENKGILALWHDESFWNQYLINKSFKELSASYCMPQQIALRKVYKINYLKPIIIALKKEHNGLRF